MGYLDGSSRTAPANLHRVLELTVSNPAVDTANYDVPSTLVNGGGEYARYYTIIPSNFKSLTSLYAYIIGQASLANMELTIGIYFGSKLDLANWNVDNPSGGAAVRLVGATTLHIMKRIDLTQWMGSPTYSTRDLAANDFLMVGLDYAAGVGGGQATNCEIVSVDMDWTI